MEKDFKILTADEVAKLDLETQVKYFNNLNEYKEEQMKTLKTEMKADSAEAIEKLREEIKADGIEQMSVLHKAIEAQGIALRNLGSTGKANSETLESIVASKAEELKAMVGDKQKSIKFKVDKATVLTTSVANSTLALREAAIGRMPRARDVIRRLFSSVHFPKGFGGVVRWVEEATNVNGAAMQAEGVKKGEGTITWIEKLLPLQTVAEWIKVSRQALYNFNFIAGEIRIKLMRDLQSKIEAEVWNGSGTAPELNGVYTSADTYTPAHSGISDANIYDLLIKTVENIVKDSEYMPNIAVMNLADINLLRLKKDSTNNYVFPTFAMSDGREIAGLTIVESSKVAANTMLVGDFDFATLYTEGPIEITVGYENDDFTRNLVTILAEETLGLLVMPVNSGAFNKVVDINAALVLLKTAV